MKISFYLQTAPKKIHDSSAVCLLVYGLTHFIMKFTIIMILWWAREDWGGEPKVAQCRGNTDRSEGLRITYCMLDHLRFVKISFTGLEKPDYFSCMLSFIDSPPI